jgi:hypothetical protein
MAWIGSLARVEAYAPRHQGVWPAFIGRLSHFPGWCSYLGSFMMQRRAQAMDDHAYRVALIKEK